MELKAIRYVVIIAFFCSGTLISQNETESDSTYVLVDMNFISDAVFMGRKDSISNPYFYPSLTYHHKSGFYGTGSFSYLSKPDEGRVDLLLLTAGFDFSIKKLDGDVSITKYFFNENSYNVISEVDADLTAQLVYDFKVVNLGLTSSIYFNSDGNNDIFLSSEISHDYISKSEKFQISPTAGFYLGSQNFYEQYYINNRFGGGRGQQQSQGNGSTQSTQIEIKESEKFGLMAIEFSLPIWYVEEPWIFSILPAYVIPKNPATLTVDDIIFEEDLENTFYWIVGIAYMF